jgi:hypothetical protein
MTQASSMKTFGRIGAVQTVSEIEAMFDQDIICHGNNTCPPRSCGKRAVVRAIPLCPCGSEPPGKDFKCISCYTKIIVRLQVAVPFRCRWCDRMQHSVDAFVRYEPI